MNVYGWSYEEPEVYTPQRFGLELEDGQSCFMFRLKRHLAIVLFDQASLVAQVVKNPPARLLSKRQQIIILGENAEKRKYSHTVVGNVNWCSCYGTIWNKIPQKIKNRTNIWSSNSTSRYLSKANKTTLIRKDISTSTFTALNKSANLENSAVATGLEKLSFHSNPKERQCQRMLKLPHNGTHLTC